MPCPTYKVDSNVSGLRYAVEACLKVLPTIAVDGYDPIWHPLEPNSYGDFGSKVSTTARNPITPSRSRRKGVVTDVEASASFASDLTQDSLTQVMQGFCYAAARQKPTNAPIDLAVIPVTAVATADDSYAVDNAVASEFIVNHIVLAAGFTNAGNNGLMTVASVSSGKVLVDQNLTVEASPPATATITAVGYEFPSADATIALSGALPRLTSASIDMTTLGLVPGEWIYVGGDAAGTTWTDSYGFARIGAITATYIEFDKIQWATAAAEIAGSKTIRIWFGTVIKNEDDPTLIVRQSYQFERTLGEDNDGTVCEYVIGCAANELTIDLKTADKAMIDMAFTACDSEYYDGIDGTKDGTRPALASDIPAFNTSSDIKRIAIQILDESIAVPTPLFAYCTDVALKIGNTVSPNKAIGVLGNFEMTAGMFDVSGSLTAYFQDLDTTRAVRENTSITLDVILVNGNAGMAFDLPLITLGNGMPAIEKDKAITIPLDTMAAQSSFGHTLLYVNFPYLPTAADS